MKNGPIEGIIDFGSKAEELGGIKYPIINIIMFTIILIFSMIYDEVIIIKLFGLEENTYKYLMKCYNFGGINKDVEDFEDNNLKTLNEI